MQKNFPGKHATLVFLVAVLLFIAFLVDQVAHSSELVDLLYILPIVTAAILLPPLETLGTGLMATILELLSENPSLQKPTQDLWTVAGIAAFGIVMAAGSFFFRRWINPLRTAHTALEVSPVAYAEFKFPSCTLVSHNEAFLKMSANGSGNRALIDLFPEKTAGILVNLLSKAVSSGRLTECMQLSIAGDEGSSSFW